MMEVTYTIHDRAGIKGNDVTVTVRNDGAPDKRSVFWLMHHHTNGFTVALPHYVPSDGITIQDVRNACSDCDGRGWLTAYGDGDQAGGWADTCQECKGTGRAA